MTLNQIFTIPRFSNLFKEEISSGYKMTFIIASVVFTFLLILSTIMAADHDFEDFHEVWYPIVLVVGGCIFTSMSFNELNRKEERMSYLLLPASIFEKFSIKLLLTTIGYLLVATILYWIFAQVSDLINQKYFNYTFSEFNPFGEHYMLMIKIYLVIQSVFILGAVTFNRFSFFKTIFSVWLLGICLGFLGFLFFRIVFADLFEGIFEINNNIKVIPDKNFQHFAEFTLWPWVQNIFWYILAPVLWIVAYFKLKEREV